MTDQTPLDPLSMDELKALWQAELDSVPPPIASRSFLSKALLYERQCNREAQLSMRDRKKLASYLDEKAAPQSARFNTVKPSVRLPPGTRLIRNWNGKTYTVSVIEEGFVFQDKVWPSLSSIARHITSAHWSGPRFFSTKTKRIAS